MYDNLFIYDNIFYFEMQIYFLSECRLHLGEYAANHGFSRMTRTTRILRGFLLVRGVPCLNQDLLDWRIFRIIDLVGLPAVGCVTFE